MLATLSFELSLALTFLLGKINVRHILWKWNPHKVVGHTLISPNKRVTARESAQKRVLLAFLLIFILFFLSNLYAMVFDTCEQRASRGR